MSENAVLAALGRMGHSKDDQYLSYLKEAKRQSEATVDAVAAALDPRSGSAATEGRLEPSPCPAQSIRVSFGHEPACSTASLSTLPSATASR